jgi:hypothetical protein
VFGNHSTDGSPDMVRTHFPAASLIESPGNLGYGAAANRVFFSHTLAHDAEFLILANSDIVFAPGSVGALVDDLREHSEAAVTGPKLLNPDRSLQRSCFPGSVRWTFDNDAVCVLLRFFPPLRERLLRLWKHDAAREVPWVKGALLAIWGAPAPQKSALQWPGSCSQVPCASPAAVLLAPFHASAAVMATPNPAIRQAWRCAVAFRFRDLERRFQDIERRHGA